MERTRLPIRSKGGKGLGAWVPLLPLEGFDKALFAEVLVPLLGELLVLLVKLGVEGVMAVSNEARPLLDTGVIVAPVLCEALDYVKWAYN